MIQVLIISSLYSQTQHLRRILLGQAGHIQLCGTADNSVLGMSLIESLHPDVVIMPVHMTFWNPEDLINYLLPRGICPRFVLLSDGSEAVIEGAAAVKVQQLLPDAMPSDAMLLHAVEEAGRLQKHETGAVRPPENEYVQHSLEVMELLMGLVPVGTGSAQQQFGRLHVGSQDCWILLGSQPDGQPGPGLSSDYAALESFFAELTELLRPLGNTDICIYRDQNLCILLAGGQDAEPDWALWAGKINALAAHHALGQMTFDISDVPLPLPQWHNQCRQLLELRKLRFFFSPLCLQPKMAFSYRVPVTQQLLHEKLSALSLSMQDARQLEALAILRELQDMVSHSMSDEVCSFVMTQLTVQMYSLSSSFGVDPAPTPLLGAQRPATVEAMFTICREQMTALFSSIRNLRTTSNSAIDEVCRFVAQNLGAADADGRGGVCPYEPGLSQPRVQKGDRAGLQRLCERAAHPPRQAAAADERPHHRYRRKRRL